MERPALDTMVEFHTLILQGKFATKERLNKIAAIEASPSGTSIAFPESGGGANGTSSGGLSEEYF